jgi:hypothetical protein
MIQSSMVNIASNWLQLLHHRFRLDYWRCPTVHGKFRRRAGYIYPAAIPAASHFIVVDGTVLHLKCRSLDYSHPAAFTPEGFIVGDVPIVHGKLRLHADYSYPASVDLVAGDLRAGVHHQRPLSPIEGRLIEEIKADKLERELEKCLLLDGRDRESIKHILADNGQVFDIDPQGYIRLTDDRSVQNLELLVELLVKSGQTPAMVHVITEDLESYFLRKISTKKE